MKRKARHKAEKKAAHPFDAWWCNDGSGMRPLPGEDREMHVRRICAIAWDNGARCALLQPYGKEGALARYYADHELNKAIRREKYALKRRNK